MNDRCPGRGERGREGSSADPAPSVRLYRPRRRAGKGQGHVTKRRRRRTGSFSSANRWRRQVWPPARAVNGRALHRDRLSGRGGLSRRPASGVEERHRGRDAPDAVGDQRSRPSAVNMFSEPRRPSGNLRAYETHSVETARRRRVVGSGATHHRSRMCAVGARLVRPHQSSAAAPAARSTPPAAEDSLFASALRKKRPPAEAPKVTAALTNNEQFVGPLARSGGRPRALRATGGGGRARRPCQPEIGHFRAPRAGLGGSEGGGGVQRTTGSVGHVLRRGGCRECPGED